MDKLESIQTPDTTNSSHSRLVIIDSHGLMFRSYFALKDVLPSGPGGEPVSAVYGYASSLLAVLADLQPTHVIAAWDASEMTFRKEIDPTYKANREPTPDDLRPQFDRVRELLGAFSIPVVEKGGYEADDVLGTLAKQAKKEGVQDTIILTLDNDIIQLVEPGVRVYMYRPYQRDYVMYDNQKVRDRFGFDPLQMIDYKGLVGDTSDNIPGVKGIGDKGAKSLINEWASLENMLANLDAIEPKRTQTALRNGRDSAVHSKMLATIVTEVPDVTLQLDVANRSNYERAEAVDFLTHMQFNSLLSRLPDRVELPPPATAEVPSHQAVLLQTADQLADLKTSAVAKGYISIFLISDSSYAVEAAEKAVGLALSVDSDSSFYFSFDDLFKQDNLTPMMKLSDESIPKSSLSTSDFFEWLCELDLLPELTFINHDIKLTSGSLRLIAETLGFRVRFEKIFDTQIAAYVLGSYNVSLKQLAKEYQLRQPVDETTIRGKGKSAKLLNELSDEIIAEYGGSASSLILEAKEILGTALAEQGLESVFYEIDLPHALALSRMEEVGIGLNSGPLIDLGSDLANQIVEVEGLAFDNVGHEFKISSPQAISELLFNELELPPTKKIKTGFSTDADSLQSLVGVHPVVEDILLWRELSKLKSTYVDALPQHVNQRTMRIHSSYSQTTAATGRLSSTHPNLQNLPVRGERGGAIRDAFIAERCGEDSIFLSIDYSQIELRILAHLSQDEALIASFLANQDIHAATAAKIFSKSIDAITSLERRRAKVFNFGVLYGLSAFGLSTREGIPRNEAQEFIDSYFAAYPAIDIWRTKTIDEAKKNGYAETLTGRRRPIPELVATNHNIRRAGERIAMNMPVQGTASDVIKIAMNNIDRELEESRKEGSLARIVMQIHDELIFELPRKELDSVRAVAARLMPSMELAVPLVLDEAVGTNLGNLKEIV